MACAFAGGAAISAVRSGVPGLAPGSPPPKDRIRNGSDSAIAARAISRRASTRPAAKSARTSAGPETRGSASNWSPAARRARTRRPARSGRRPLRQRRRPARRSWPSRCRGWPASAARNWRRSWRGPAWLARRPGAGGRRPRAGRAGRRPAGRGRRTSAAVRRTGSTRRCAGGGGTGGSGVAGGVPGAGGLAVPLSFGFRTAVRGGRAGRRDVVQQNPPRQRDVLMPNAD